MRILYTKGVHPVPLPTLSFPSIFTPNGDAVNNALWIQNLEYYPGNHMKIQDPYSLQVLYETDNYHLNPWNGRVNNIISPWPGTFPDITVAGYYTFGCFLTGPTGANHNFMVQVYVTYLFQEIFNATLGDKFKVALWQQPTGSLGTPTTYLTAGYWSPGHFAMTITDFSYPSNIILTTTNYGNISTGAGPLSPYWDGTLNNDGVTLCPAGMYKWTAVADVTYSGYVTLVR